MTRVWRAGPAEAGLVSGPPSLIRSFCHAEPGLLHYYSINMASYESIQVSTCTQQSHKYMFSDIQHSALTRTLAI